MGFNSGFKGLTKFEFARRVFEKGSNIKIFMKILPVGAELFHSDGRPDRHDEANSRFAQFCGST